MARLIVGGEIDSSAVSLRFFGEDLEPDHITEVLGCLPSSKHRQGEVIGRKRYRRVASSGCWILALENNPQPTLEEKINRLLDLTRADIPTWIRLTSQYQTDMFCGVFLDAMNRGFGLSSQTLGRLAERNIAVEFDIYCP